MISEDDLFELYEEERKEKISPEEFDTLWEPEQIEENEDGQLDI